MVLYLLNIQRYNLFIYLFIYIIYKLKINIYNVKIKKFIYFNFNKRYIII